MGLQRGKRYLSAREIARFQPFDSKLVAALSVEPILRDYKSRKINGELKYSLGDWVRARRRYYQRNPPRDL